MFKPFPKVARLSRPCVVTEKIDGMNAQVFIRRRDLSTGMPADALAWIPKVGDTGMLISAGTRTRFVVPGDGNFGFAKWVYEHADELVEGLGEGRHFGEWWGQGIKRGYGLDHKRFSLFNVGRWGDDVTNDRPECCHVVPVLRREEFDTNTVLSALWFLEAHGSVAARGFMRPEGVMVWHEDGRVMFKKTIENDARGKGR